MFRKFILIIFTLSFPFLFFSPSVYAQCPVCTVTVGGAVLLSRYLGVDDLLVGIWVGGFIITFGLWSATLVKRNFFKGQNWVITLVLWLTTVWGLKLAGFIGNPTCKIHGHDKLLSGTIGGTLVFLIAYFLDQVLRKINKKNPGKAFFPYQKVIIPVVLLIVATLVGAKICEIRIF